MDLSVPGRRPPLPAEAVARIRRERQHPRLWQWDGYHLAAVRSGIVRALKRLPAPRGAVLDVWCGAKPYDVLVGAEVVVGLDIDRHFGGADVISSTPFPIRDGAVELALCSQALHILPPEVAAATVGELTRVVAPGGHAIVTVPGVMLRAGPSAIEGRISAADLEQLFAEWDEVTVHASGGLGAALSHGLNMLIDALRRRLRLPAVVPAPAYVIVNLVGAAVDVALRPLAARYPHLLIMTARRPAASREA